MNELEVTTRFALNPKLAYTLIDEEAVLLGLADERLYGLNSVATEMLRQLVQQPMSIAMMSEYLLAEFEVDADQSLADTRAFFAGLLAQDMIVRAQ